METTLTKKQVKYFVRNYYEDRQYWTLRAEVCYDDERGNGHNTFHITGTIYHATKGGERDKRYRDCDAAGMLHDEIKKHIPHLAPYLKWHGTSSDSPMHYIANTMYWIKEGNLDYARNCAVWAEATDAELLASDIEQRLKDRLPDLMIRFQADMLYLGFDF